jgi:hypothetical protein
MHEASDLNIQLESKVGFILLDLPLLFNRRRFKKFSEKFTSGDWMVIPCLRRWSGLGLDEPPPTP